MYAASHCCYLLLHTVQFTFVAVHRPVYFCCQMLCSLPFVAMCRTVAIGAAYRAGYFFCHTPYSSVFIAACHAVYYSLPCSVQSLLVLHTVQFTSVATLRTVQYSLLHAMQFAVQLAIRCCYLLPHAVQLLCVNTCRIVCYLLLLSAATCHTVAMCCCILCSHYSACGLVAIYVLLHAVHLPFAATKVGASISCRMPDSCYLLLAICHSYSQLLCISLLS